jgi:hypothetical protein
MASRESPLVVARRQLWCPKLRPAFTWAWIILSWALFLTIKMNTFDLLVPFEIQAEVLLLMTGLAVLVVHIHTFFTIDYRHRGWLLLGTFLGWLLLLMVPRGEWNVTTALLFGFPVVGFVALGTWIEGMD